MRRLAVALIFLLLTGCATSAAERRMHDAGGDDDHTMRNVGIGLAMLAVGAAAYYGAKGGGSGYAAAPTTDYDWDWDLQNAPYGGLQWVCRGVQTAQYAEQWHCSSKLKTDARWPGY